jgi:hypothetical protein
MNEATKVDAVSRWKSVAGIALERPMALTVTLLCAVLAMSVKPFNTLAPQVQDIHQWTMAIGLVAWLWWMLVHGVLEAIEGGRQFQAIVEHGYVRLALVVFVLLAERSMGHELAWVMPMLKDNPDMAYSIALGAIFVYAAFSFAPRMLSSGMRVATIRAVMTAEAPRWARERKDIHRTSIHEAGHVLMFTLKRTLPSWLKVEVFTHLNHTDEYRGKVTHPNESGDVLLESELVWNMLLSLSGTEAEHLVFGERANGTFGDNQSWMESAHAYLSSGFGEPYYSKPRDEAQYEHNLLVMTRLKDACGGRVKAFLAANQDLLQELGADIAEHHVLELVQLQPYLARVVGTEGVMDVRIVC